MTPVLNLHLLLLLCCKKKKKKWLSSYTPHPLYFNNSIFFFNYFAFKFNFILIYKFLHTPPFVFVKVISLLCHLLQFVCYIQDDDSFMALLLLPSSLYIFCVYMPFSLSLSFLIYCGNTYCFFFLNNKIISLFLFI